MLLLDVRLVGIDSNERMGLVEIYRNGYWGTVCDDGWDIVDAGVVCKQLGFLDGADAMGLDRNFGQGTGEILFTNVECTGNENKISDCPSSSALLLHHFPGRRSGMPRLVSLIDHLFAKRGEGAQEWGATNS